MHATALLAIYLLVAFFCIYTAERMAYRRGRSRTPWMWAVVIFGPLPLLLLALLPRRLPVATA